MNTSIQLRSEITSAGTLNLYLEKGTVPEPKDDEVIVRVEAAPINPSDLGIMLGPADISTLQVTGESNNPRVSMDIPEDKLQSVAARHDVAMPVGIEGAGTVVAAGLEAKALLGKVVCISGGGLYSQYRCAKASACLVLNEGVTAIEAASSFVNPMTSLGMVETMRMENHTALVHTAAASNLGQMLVRICNAGDVALVNIVRKKEQVELLKDLGAEYVCNSSDASFMSDLVSALTATGATIAFDATGGGTLTNQILTAMEIACGKDAVGYSRYGSTKHKQVYIYGGLDRAVTVLDRSYGMSWGVSGWLVTSFIAKIGMERNRQLRQRIADELDSTFASTYTRVISLSEALSEDIIGAFTKQATGEKYLINPNKALNS